MSKSPALIGWAFSLGELGSRRAICIGSAKSPYWLGSRMDRYNGLIADARPGRWRRECAQWHRVGARWLWLLLLPACAAFGYYAISLSESLVMSYTLCIWEEPRPLTFAD